MERESPSQKNVDFDTDEIADKDKQLVNDSSSENVLYTCETCRESFKNRSLFKNHFCCVADDSPTFSDVTQTSPDDTQTSRVNTDENLPNQQDLLSAISDKPTSVVFDTSETVSLTVDRDYDHEEKLLPNSPSSTVPETQNFEEWMGQLLREYRRSMYLLCDGCGNRYSTPKSLDNHLCSGRPLICKYCNIELETIMLLKSHLKLCLKYPCDTCSLTFTSKRNLLRHRQTIHEAELHKLHKCKFCDKIFARKDYLTSHMKSHTGEKTYKCCKCFKLFSKKVYLISHYKSHTQEKQFNCRICGKKFNYQSAAIRHEKKCRVDGGETSTDS